MPDNSLVRVESVSKNFAGVRALENVTFDLRPGEVHAILGENGAGKSTLIKVIGGVHTPDSGRLFVKGSEVTLRSPRQAQLLGIRVIHQELNLVPLVSVAENIFLGNLPAGRPLGLVAWRQLREKCEEIQEHLGMRLDLRAQAGQLTAGEQQMVEIAQALTSEVDILVMDEPTAALNDSETERLFDLLRKMARDGIGIIYITHRIGEVFKIAHRVTVLRDGKRIGTVNVGEMATAELISMMVGRTLEAMYPRNRVEPGEVLLEARNLSSPEGLDSICLQVRAREIVGIYGLLGSGQTQLANSLLGLSPLSNGEVLIAGKRCLIKSPAGAKKFSIGYVPAQRKAEALVMPLSVRKNFTVGNVRKYTRAGFFLDEKRERAACADFVQSLAIRTASLESNIGELSGGNQQKILFARLMDSGAGILVLNEPTHGVDVGAKVDLYTLMDRLCQQGVGILLFSSEMPELLGIADRIIVMSAGRITAEYSYDEATQEKLLRSAIAQSPSPGRT